MRDAGSFTISWRDFGRAYRDGRVRFETIALPLVVADPDCFELDGDPRAADRWVDDGGRSS